MIVLMLRHSHAGPLAVRGSSMVSLDVFWFLEHIGDDEVALVNGHQYAVAIYGMAVEKQSPILSAYRQWSTGGPGAHTRPAA